MNRNAVFYYVAGVVTAFTLLTFKRLIFSDNRPGGSAQGKRKKAVFFGDSITSHGFSVAINANDAVDARVGQHVPLAEYALNMQGIVEKIKKGVPAAKVILITPPPIWEEKVEQMNLSKGKPWPLDRTNERTYEYVKLVKQLGQNMNVPVVDAWSSMSGSTTERADYLSDGLHLNAKGNYRLFEAVREVVLQHYPEFSPEALPMHMHEWAQMIELDKQRLLK